MTREMLPNGRDLFVDHCFISAIERFFQVPGQLRGFGGNGKRRNNRRCQVSAFAASGRRLLEIKNQFSFDTKLFTVFIMDKAENRRAPDILWSIIEI